MQGSSPPVAGTPEPGIDRSELASRYVPPRTPTEEALAAIWSELLQVDRVGIDDDFFELGGHSLLAAQAVSRLTESFNIQLSIRSLFEKPVVADLAREIERLMSRPAPQRGPGIARVSREAYRVNPVSPGSGADRLKRK